MTKTTLPEKLKSILLAIFGVFYLYGIFKCVTESKPIITIPMTILLLGIPLLASLIDSRKKLIEEDAKKKEQIIKDEPKSKIKSTKKAYKKAKRDDRNTPRVKKQPEPPKKTSLFEISMWFTFFTGIIFFILYAVMFLKTSYAYYGKFILIAIGFVLSLLITFLCNIKSKANKVMIIIMLTVFITPMISAINTSFNVTYVDIASAKVIDKNIKTYKRNKTYYLYVDKASIPTVNNKFECSEFIYNTHSTGSNLYLTYKKGLLGLQFVETNY